MASSDAVDAVYEAYVTILGCAAATLFLADLIGDERVSAATLATVIRLGPAIVGIAFATGVAAALRSGSRGGPLVVEPPDVRHVLLAPLDRGGALRSVAAGRIRAIVTRAAAGGAVAGLVASHRLPGGTAPWAATGAFLAATTAATLFGIALVASGLRAQPRVAQAIGGLAVGLGGIGFARPESSLSLSWVGAVALWPVRPAPAEAIALLGVAVAGLSLGLAVVGGVSLEAAERRGALVGQLRFAAVLRDLRAVVLIRRQLAAESPRRRPWVRLHAGRSRRGAIGKRDLEGTLRWPVRRVVRVIGFAAGSLAGAAAAYSGTTAGLAIAGVFGWITALETLEGLAADVDRPDLRRQLPVSDVRLLWGHLAAPTAMTVALFAGVASVAAATLPREWIPNSVVIVAMTAASCAIASAVVSIVRGAPDPLESARLYLYLPEEAMGAQMLTREALPPLIAGAGWFPLIAAREAAPHAATDALLAASAVALLVPTMVAWWLLHRRKGRL